MFLCPSSCWGFLSHGIGCIVLTKFLFDVYQFINAMFLRPGKDLVQKYGDWALVTGATDGIGKAIALELARKGMKVLLVSRSAERLADALKEVQAVPKSKGGDVCVIDFSGEFTEAKKETLRKAMAGKDIGVLVNNVGISYDHPDFFDALEPSRVDQLIKLNIDSTTVMTHLVLPQMVERKRGAVVNISSALAKGSCPLYAGYSAAKEYIVRFTHCLHAEYKAKGVDFQVQTPAFVTSKISKIRNPSLSTPTPETFAKASVKAIGYESEISPYWVHYLIAAVYAAAPNKVADFVCMKMHLPIRAKALKKKAEKTK